MKAYPAPFQRIRAAERWLPVIPGRPKGEPGIDNQKVRITDDRTYGFRGLSPGIDNKRRSVG